MTRKLKAIGLAFAAVAAMSLIPAAATQGSELHAITAGPSANITGEQTTQHRFQATPPAGPATTCNSVHFEGTVSITSQHQTVTPIYTGCTAFGQTSTVNMNGCKFTFTGSGNPALTAKVDIVGCTAGKQIEGNTAICQKTIPEQATIGGHVVFSNGGSPSDLVATFTLTGITYQLHGAVCGHTVTTTTHDGTYQGSATFKAFVSTQPQQATHNGHQYSTTKNGAQVALTAT
jgi:hypothetical protein